jgi:hypothetical protein
LRTKQNSREPTEPEQEKELHTDPRCPPFLAQKQATPTPRNFFNSMMPLSQYPIPRFPAVVLRYSSLLLLILLATTTERAVGFQLTSSTGAFATETRNTFAPQTTIKGMKSNWMSNGNPLLHQRMEKTLRFPKSSSTRLFVSPLRTTTAAAGSVIASMLITADPAVEAHVLSDVAHVGLDLAVFMGQGVLALRLAAVLGRLCAMGADYLPDHTIIPEELVFQLAMLAFSCWGLLRAAILPSAAAVAWNITIRDGKAFHSLFQPTGLTWNTYKAMTAVGAVDWVTLNCTEQVVENDAPGGDRHVYWLYDGQMELQSCGNNNNIRPSSSSSSKARRQHELPPKLVISRSKRDSATNAPAALLAEHRLLESSSSGSATTTATSSKTIPNSTIAAHVTSETATFLRLNVSRLRRFITDHDPAAAEAMRVLVVQGLDAKLEAHWSRLAQI